MHLLEHLGLHHVCLRLLGLLVEKLQGRVVGVVLGSHFCENLRGECGGGIHLHLKPMKSGHLVSHEVFYLMQHGVAELMRHKVYEVCLCKKG